MGLEFLGRIILWLLFVSSGIILSGIKWFSMFLYVVVIYCIIVIIIM